MFGIFKYEVDTLLFQHDLLERCDVLVRDLSVDLRRRVSGGVQNSARNGYRP